MPATIQDLYSNLPTWQMSPVWNSMFGGGQPPAAPVAPGTAGQPRTGQGAFGLVPGATALPDPYGDLSKQFPGLGATNAKLSGNILSKLSGELPKDVQDYIQNVGAQYGVGSGMPGSGLARSRTARDLGLTSLDLTRQGAAEYASTIPTISRTQTVSPETQIGLAEHNAALAAAPDPALAQMASLDIYNRYLNAISSRSGPAGGSGGYVQRPPSFGSTPQAPGTPTAPPTQNYNLPPSNEMSDAEWDWYFGGQGLPQAGTVTDNSYHVPTDQEWDIYGASLGISGPEYQDMYYYPENYQ